MKRRSKVPIPKTNHHRRLRVIRHQSNLRRPLTGYVQTKDGQLVKAPDPSVADVIRGIFRTYIRLGSVRNVAQYNSKRRARQTGHVDPTEER